MHLHETFGLDVDAGSVVVVNGFRFGLGSQQVDAAEIGSVAIWDVHVPLQHLFGEVDDLGLAPAAILILVENRPGKLAELALQGGVCDGARRLSLPLVPGKAAAESRDAEWTPEDAGQDNVLMYNGPPQSASRVSFNRIPVALDLGRIDVEADGLRLTSHRAEKRPEGGGALGVEQVGSDQELRMDGLQCRCGEERAETQRLIGGREEEIRDIAGDLAWADGGGCASSPSAVWLAGVSAGAGDEALLACRLGCCDASLVRKASSILTLRSTPTVVLSRSQFFPMAQIMRNTASHGSET